MKNTGILRIQAFGARQSSPIEGVLVTVSGNGFTAQRITDETGTAADISIEAPSCALSLQEDNTIRPYAVVDLTAAKAGFRTVRIQGVQIFAGQVTLAQPEMIPETEEGLYVANPPVVIPEHSLFTGDGGSGPDPMENCMPRVLSRVIIPKNITVHLGKPAASARNVTVSFRDYIANVASSEVYPTWPEQALRANIHCQISLALNRIYTEWYPSKGYTFNITNSTSYDQYYVHGRTVFDVMVRITNDRGDKSRQDHCTGEQRDAGGSRRNHLPFGAGAPRAHPARGQRALRDFPIISGREPQRDREDSADGEWRSVPSIHPRADGACNGCRCAETP